MDSNEQYTPENNSGEDILSEILHEPEPPMAEAPLGAPTAPIQPPQAVTQQAPPVSPYPQPQANYTAAPNAKASPFANSPYINRIPAAPYQNPSQQSWSTSVPPASPAAAPAPAKKKERKTRAVRPWQLIVVGAVLVCLIVISCGITATLVSEHWQEQNTNMAKSFNEKINVLRDELEEQTSNNSGNSVSGTPNVTPDGSLTPAQVYAQNVSSVVAINCTGIATNNYGQSAQTASSGSGFILSEDGYVVTNYHVVEGATSLKVSMSDGITYDAEYIGGNESNDIAMIKMNATGLRPVVIGKSSDLIVGDQVAAIGNPLGELAATLTVGYVSAKDRIVATDGTQINMLQTDAAINPGNSGGPLFNMKGEVIGITSAKYSGTTSSGASIEGIGFAIPTDDVMQMLDDLKNYGYITGGYLGVYISDVSSEASEMYGLPLGVLIRDVIAGSCSEKAGIKTQDIIINLGGHDIKNSNDLSRALNKFKAGETVSVTVYRNGSQKVLSVTLDERPQEEPPVSNIPENNTTPGNVPGNGGFDSWFDFFFGN